MEGSDGDIRSTDAISTFLSKISYRISIDRVTKIAARMRVAKAEKIELWYHRLLKCNEVCSLPKVRT